MSMAHPPSRRLDPRFLVVGRLESVRPDNTSCIHAYATLTARIADEWMLAWFGAWRKYAACLLFAACFARDARIRAALGASASTCPTYAVPAAIFISSRRDIPVP